MHVYPRRKKSLKKKEKKSIVEYGIYGIAILAPAMTIPQFIAVWVDRNTQGVSVLTWTAYAVAAIFWLCYGLVRREKPIILANVGLVAVDILIVIGVLLAQ